MDVWKNWMLIGCDDGIIRVGYGVWDDWILYCWRIGGGKEWLDIFVIRDCWGMVDLEYVG